MKQRYIITSTSLFVEQLCLNPSVNAGLCDSQEDAIDFDKERKTPLWDESNNEADFDAHALLENELELEALAHAKAKEAEAKAKEAATIAMEAAAVEDVGLQTKSYAESKYLVTNEQMRRRECSVEGRQPITISEVWQAAKALVTHYEGKVVAIRCLEGLRNFVKSYCDTELIDENEDVKVVAMLLWTASKYGGSRAELCSLLNRALREDKQAPALVFDNAVLLARALNKNLVAFVENRESAGDRSLYRNWPNGPNVDKHSEGWSTKANSTWRGGAMPREDFQWWLELDKKATEAKKFRTRMFVASSFNRSVAEHFAEKAYNKSDPDGTGKVLFLFNFERHNCLHVNYIDKSGYPQEKEFLMPPYTTLELVRVQESFDLDVRPHMIELNVMRDNQSESTVLELANRI